LDEDISTKFGGQIRHGHMEMIAGSLITLLTTSSAIADKPRDAGL